MFNHIAVAVEGSSSTNITELAQITMVNSLRFDFSVYNPTLVQAVGNAIRDSGMGLTPVKGDRDTIWTVKVAKPSAEAREAFVKVAGQRCEKTRTEIRGYRKDGMDKVRICYSLDYN